MTIELKHHEFKASTFEDEHGPAVMLEQSDGWSSDAPQIVIVHPSQLREVCERFGILSADKEAAKTIATLQRRLLALRDRINAARQSPPEAECIGALAMLADEWCIDFAPRHEPECTGAPEQCAQGSLI